jgi:hypothetical protein
LPTSLKISQLGIYLHYALPFPSGLMGLQHGLGVLLVCRNQTDLGSDRPFCGLVGVLAPLKTERKKILDRAPELVRHADVRGSPDVPERPEEQGEGSADYNSLLKISKKILPFLLTRHPLTLGGKLTSAAGMVK